MTLHRLQPMDGSRHREPPGKRGWTAGPGFADAGRGRNAPHPPQDDAGGAVMSAGTAHLTAAGLFLLLALVWSVLAERFWQLARIARQRPSLRYPAWLSLPPVVLLALVAWIGVLQQLLPPALREQPSGARH